MDKKNYSKSNNVEEKSDNLNILKEIHRNNTREKEIQQELKKEDGLS